MIKIMIVEDEGLFRDMLKISLGALSNLEVVEAVSDGNAAVEAASRVKPDVILMDIELGSEPNGIAAGRAIKGDHPDMGIVILSSHRERQYISLITVEEASGWSYLLKQSVSDAGSLVRAIEGAASGLVVMDPAVVNSMKPRKGSLSAGLTPRQHSTGGKARLGKTSKMGQRDLRRLLIIGASAVVRWAERQGAPAGSWLERMLAKKPRMLVTVALANKMARMAWALMAKGGVYRAPAPVA